MAEKLPNVVYTDNLEINIHIYSIYILQQFFLYLHFRKNSAASAVAKYTYMKKIGSPSDTCEHPKKYDHSFITICHGFII